jgi:hypothetical protein
MLGAAGGLHGREARAIRPATTTQSIQSAPREGADIRQAWGIRIHQNDVLFV